MIPILVGLALAADPACPNASTAVELAESMEAAESAYAGMDLTKYY